VKDERLKGAGSCCVSGQYRAWETMPGAAKQNVISSADECAFGTAPAICANAVGRRLGFGQARSTRRRTHHGRFGVLDRFPKPQLDQLAARRNAPMNTRPTAFQAQIRAGNS
jgi:hypothetical protein